MDLKDLAQPRFLLGALVIIIMAILMYLQTIQSNVGITVIIGVLAALGLWEGRSRMKRG